MTIERLTARASGPQVTGKNKLKDRWIASFQRKSSFQTAKSHGSQAVYNEAAATRVSRNKKDRAIPHFISRLMPPSERGKRGSLNLRPMLR